MINPKNWTFLQYQLDDLYAFVSQGGDWVNEQFQEVFYVTVLHRPEGALESEVNERFQKQFQSLEEACDFANHSYAHFDIVDLLQNDDAGGCSTCGAH